MLKQLDKEALQPYRKTTSKSVVKAVAKASKEERKLGIQGGSKGIKGRKKSVRQKSAAGTVVSSDYHGP